MHNDRSVSKSVIARLPRYYRFLCAMEAEGVDRVSSGELSRRMSLTASQIRQDFNCFGCFGQQGYGYNVTQLRRSLGQIIGIDSHYRIILIGAGNMGRAVCQHMDFAGRGFDLIGVFDADPEKIGKELRELPILPESELEAFCKSSGPMAAILCVPDQAARDLAGRLVACGVRYFWNFTHYAVQEDFPDVYSENVHLNDSLMKLCFNITND